jgi:LuxR family transcriptional regulator, maltose regulon positive regulatory protein
VSVEHRDWVGALTRREVGILSLLRTHQTYAQIAETLFVSENTVKSHVAHIYTKLGAHNRDHAIARARGMGFFASHPKEDRAGPD